MNPCTAALAETNLCAEGFATGAWCMHAPACAGEVIFWLQVEDAIMCKVKRPAGGHPRRATSGAHQSQGDTAAPQAALPAPHRSR